MKILAVIPARGGSKGIPKKNIRLLAGKPLIAYSIQNALACTGIDDVYVSTDSDEIAEIADDYGAGVIRRNHDLSGDLVTLDPVIFDAVSRIEAAKGYTYDFVITMQPTSPLLKPESLSAAIDSIRNGSSDCLISVVNKPHLAWKSQNGKLVPAYEERRNRQELPPYYLETGAFVISKRSLITRDTRMAGTVSVFPISENEGIDIDDKNDWVLSEALLGRKRIVFRADGYARLGMGHIYNCITLAYAMIEHDVLLVIQEDSSEGIKKVKETNLPYQIIRQEKEIDGIIENFKPDIWVCDKLNTTVDTVSHLKELVPRVVTIEDLGPGTRYADAVINALYTDRDLKGENIYSGWKYVCLRDEFQVERPNRFSDRVRNVMIMFGGTDPSNFNRMLYDIISRIALKYKTVNFNFIVGIGYDTDGNGLHSIEEKNIFVYSDVQRVTKYMKQADLAITSQGRAIFEFACMGVPAIVLSQNEREKTHSFASMEHGFINLGTEKEVDSDLIENTLDWLINTRAVRENMYNLMLKYPLREGLRHVRDIILGK
ncbi:MAG: N-acylneuraminate cytidylyltransferase [Eubacterium sp.]|jgi:CMP-N-acetylneuraminic acid synthetase|nr:N-acylneuraminate cytidylyltransferase [Eubacterium sp.]